MIGTRRGPAAALLALLVLTAAVYLPVLGHEFVWDDAEYVTGNRALAGGLTPGAARWAFSSFHGANWHPVTWLSHALDISLFGTEPAGHHAFSLALHLVNTALVLRVLHALTGSFRPSLAAAALFALHPLRVQTVAWVAERKGLLAGLFWLCAVEAYRRWARRPAPVRFLAVAGFFVLGLLSKPVVVALPLALLVLDYWPLGRLAPTGREGGQSFARLALEKAPLFLLAAAAGTTVFLAQRTGGAVRTLEEYSIGTRLANAAIAYAGYLGKAVLPLGLSVTYPHEGAAVSAAAALAAAALLATLTTVAVLRRRRLPAVAAGWAWFLLTLLPTIGLVQVGAQSMADRYTYLPLLGVFIAVAWGARALHASGATSGGRAFAAAAAALAAVALLAAATRHALGFWKDEVALWQRAVDLQPSALAHTNLGVGLAGRGRSDEAVAHYETAIALNPGDANTWYCLGLEHALQGRWSDAEPALRESLRLQPQQAPRWGELGLVLMNLGRELEAEDALRRAVGLQPDLVAPAYNLALLHLRRGDREAARRVAAGLRAVNPAGARELDALVGGE